MASMIYGTNGKGRSWIRCFQEFPECGHDRHAVLTPLTDIQTQVPDDPDFWTKRAARRQKSAEETTSWLKKMARKRYRG